jgi:soluble lytic murein transglycosylase
MSLGQKQSFILLFLVIFILAPIAAKGGIYTFVDKNGVIHFSNVPNDSRYKPVSKTPKRLRSCKIINSRQCAGHIRVAARKYGVDPCLVKAVIKTESNFNCLAVSRKGAQGLMQLMPGTSRDMRVKNPFNPKDNILGGTRYLRKMLDIFNGDLKLALAAYNSGPERVKELGRIPRIRETVNYVNRVLRHYRQYKKYSSGV